MTSAPRIHGSKDDEEFVMMPRSRATVPASTSPSPSLPSAPQPSEQVGIIGHTEPAALMDDPRVSCIVRPAVAGIMGYPMGLAFAFLFPSHDINNMPGVGPDAKTRVKVMHSFKLSARHGMENGRTFAKMGLIWSASECAMEVYRGRTDMWNPLTAGCFTGGVMAWGSGPVGMGIGCAGLAGFAVAIDLFMGSHRAK